MHSLFAYSMQGNIIRSSLNAVLEFHLLQPLRYLMKCFLINVRGQPDTIDIIIPILLEWKLRLRERL